MMRKININELKEVSEMFADIFINYPLFRVFFNDYKISLKKSIYYYFRMSTYKRRKFTYIAEDKNCAAIVRAPGDKDKSFLPLLVDCTFFKHYFKANSGHAAKLSGEYDNFAVKASTGIKRSGDYYVKNIGVAASARGRGLLRKMLDELCGDNGVVLETHDPKNIPVYENLGFKLVKTDDFRGCSHYIMRRAAAGETD